MRHGMDSVRHEKRRGRGNSHALRSCSQCRGIRGGPRKNFARSRDAATRRGRGRRLSVSMSVVPLTMNVTGAPSGPIILTATPAATTSSGRLGRILASPLHIPYTVASALRRRVMNPLDGEGRLEGHR